MIATEDHCFRVLYGTARHGRVDVCLDLGLNKDASAMTICSLLDQLIGPRGRIRRSVCVLSFAGVQAASEPVPFQLYSMVTPGSARTSALCPSHAASSAPFF